MKLDPVLLVFTLVFGVSSHLKPTLEEIHRHYMKPGALRHSMVLGQLHEKIQNAYKEYYLDSPLEFIEILKLIQTTSPEGLISAIDHMTENGIVPGYDTLRLFLFQNLSPMIEPLEIIDPVTVTEPDLTIYVQMMRCEAWPKILNLCVNNSISLVYTCLHRNI